MHRETEKTETELGFLIFHSF